MSEAIVQCVGQQLVLQENTGFAHRGWRCSFFRPIKHFRHSCSFSLKRVHACVREKKANWMSETGSGCVSFGLAMWSEDFTYPEECEGKKAPAVPQRSMQLFPTDTTPRHLHERRALPPLPSAACLRSHVGTRCPQNAVKPENQRKMVSEGLLPLLNYFLYCIVNLATKLVWNRSWRF